MSQESFTGHRTFQELADFLKISHTTLRKKIAPLRPFLNYNKRKRLFTPEEWDFVIANLNARVTTDLTKGNAA